MALPLIGAGLTLGGTALNAYGQYRGNRAMADEAQRQFEEEQAARAALDLKIKSEMDRRLRLGGPGGAEMDARGRALAPMVGSMRSGAAALGGALGTGGRGASLAGRGEIGARLQADVGALRDVSGQDTAGVGVMEAGMDRISAEQALRRSMYEANLKDAASQGGAYRQIGGMMTAAGQTLFPIGLDRQFLDPAIAAAREKSEAATALMNRPAPASVQPPMGAGRVPTVGAPAGYPGFQVPVQYPGQAPRMGPPAGIMPGEWDKWDAMYSAYGRPKPPAGWDPWNTVLGR